jgi:hypothetical protein
MWEAEVGESPDQAGLGKSSRPYVKTKAERVQVIEHLQAHGPEFKPQYHSTKTIIIKIEPFLL